MIITKEQLGIMLKRAYDEGYEYSCKPDGFGVAIGWSVSEMKRSLDEITPQVEAMMTLQQTPASFEEIMRTTEALKNMLNSWQGTLDRIKKLMGE